MITGRPIHKNPCSRWQHLPVRDYGQQAGLWCTETARPKSIGANDLRLLSRLGTAAKGRTGNRPGGIRTPDPGIMSQPATPVNLGENADSRQSAAPGAAVSAENSPIAPDLAEVLAAWTALPTSTRAQVLAVVRAVQAAKGHRGAAGHQGAVEVESPGLGDATAGRRGSKGDEGLRGHSM